MALSRPSMMPPGAIRIGRALAQLNRLNVGLSARRSPHRLEDRVPALGPPTPPRTRPRFLTAEVVARPERTAARSYCGEVAADSGVVDRRRLAHDGVIGVYADAIRGMKRPDEPAHTAHCPLPHVGIEALADRLPGRCPVLGAPIVATHSIPVGRAASVAARLVPYELRDPTGRRRPSSVTSKSSTVRPRTGAPSPLTTSTATPTRAPTTGTAGIDADSSPTASAISAVRTIPAQPCRGVGEVCQKTEAPPCPVGTAAMGNSRLELEAEQELHDPVRVVASAGLPEWCRSSRSSGTGAMFSGVRRKFGSASLARC